MVQLIQDFDKEVKIVKASESAVTVYFGVEIRIDLHQKVKALMTYLENKQFPWLVEVIPAFSSVTILYNPFQTPGTCSPSDYVCQKLKDCIMALKKEDNQKVRTVTIPVCYGGSFGPDLSIVAKHNQLSPEEVIDIHSSGEYLVYMVGFAPGFPYLGGMSNRIATPRKEQPRMEIPKGSVGIAGVQTGVYSISTPGGWQLIGRTPLELFLKDEDPPSLLQSGDVVRFQPITSEEYWEYKEGSD